jgi:hydroxymethylpyrimidine/phosphomethylpyrimidine kinase
MQTVLTIAGFDPSSGAGVTADLMVFAAHGLFATACITAVTIQSTLGVRSTHPIPTQVVSGTLACLDSDLPPAGIKIGMLCEACKLSAICEYLQSIHLQHSHRTRPIVVLDPILKSTSGRELLDPAAIPALRDRLLPLVDWITPNLAELAVLSGQPVAVREDIPHACNALQSATAATRTHPLGIFATGGHLDSPDDFLLTPGGDALWLPGERVLTDSTHGTGCALSSAFLSRLVLGDPPPEAALAAKRYVAGALRTAQKLGSGNGPMNHLWPLLNQLSYDRSER